MNRCHKNTEQLLLRDIRGSIIFGKIAPWGGHKWIFLRKLEVAWMWRWWFRGGFPIFFVIFFNDLPYLLFGSLDGDGWVVTSMDGRFFFQRFHIHATSHFQRETQLRSPHGDTFPKIIDGGPCKYWQVAPCFSGTHSFPCLALLFDGINKICVQNIPKKRISILKTLKKFLKLNYANSLTPHLTPHPHSPPFPSHLVINSLWVAAFSGRRWLLWFKFPSATHYGWGSYTCGIKFLSVFHKSPLLKVRRFLWGVKYLMGITLAYFFNVFGYIPCKNGWIIFAFLWEVNAMNNKLGNYV
jgi:hypothetical protein